MSDNDIKLTTTDNATKSGVSFPSTPKPQILKENFASVEFNNVTTYVRNKGNNEPDSEQ